MDRGIKIAILCACLLSLGLGIYWNSVIDIVRPDPKDRVDALKMEPDRVSISVGAPSTPLELPRSDEGDNEPATRYEPIETGNSTKVEAVESTSDGSFPASIRKHIKNGKYVIQAGDSWWKIAHSTSRFKFLGKDSADWERANPKVKLRPGNLLNIPN